MSQDLMIYIGAYVEVTKLPFFTEVVENEQHRGTDCTKKCDYGLLSRKAKFCPSCGNPVHLVIERIKVDHQWEMSEVSEEFSDSFFWPNGCNWGCEELEGILLPNGDGKWGKYYEDNGFGVIDQLPKLDNPEGVFKKKFAKDLARLERKGATYVIKTGIVAYYT